MIERQFARIRRDYRRLTWGMLTPAMLYGGLDPRIFPQYRMAVVLGTL